MRAKGWVAEIAFLAVVAGSLAAPALTSAGRHLAAGSGSSGSSSSGSSSGSSNGSSSGSSSGSSNGSSNGSSSRSGSGGKGGTTTRTDQGRGSSSSSSDGHAVTPDLARYTVIPAVGTVLYGTLRNLPPFLVLACVLGALGVQVDEPLGVTDPFSASNRACAHITVKRLPDDSGPFSDPPAKVHTDDIRLTIRVDRDNHVTVTPSLPDQDQNRLLLSLLAAALIVIVALAIALVRRQQRP